RCGLTSIRTLGPCGASSTAWLALGGSTPIVGTWPGGTMGGAAGGGMKSAPVPFVLRTMLGAPVTLSPCICAMPSASTTLKVLYGSWVIFVGDMYSGAPNESWVWVVAGTAVGNGQRSSAQILNWTGPVFGLPVVAS